MTANFRGAFYHEEDPDYWKMAVATFPNRVPSFTEKKEAVDFVKKFCALGSNPYEPYLHQSISTLTTWDQISNVMMKRYKDYDQRYAPILPTDTMLSRNRFADASDNNQEGQSVYFYLLSRLNLSIHRLMWSVSTMNTLKYLFYHMRCGIFVMIRNNEVVIFCPFVNKDYKNTWGDVLDINAKSLEDYYSEKRRFGREENVLPDMRDWWANGNIICNEHCKPSEDIMQTQWWGDNFLFQIKDMICETCRCKEVPDCDFFVNKRDYPQLKFNENANNGTGAPVEPYGFIFNKDDRDPAQDVPLSEHQYSSYAPIMSFYSSNRFADIPLPSSEDWEAATGKVFPASFGNSLDPTTRNIVLAAEPRDLFTEGNFSKFQRAWEDKTNTAFFRGTATGGGVTAETNQRLRLALLSHEWSLDPTRNGGVQVDIPVRKRPRLEEELEQSDSQSAKVAARGCGVGGAPYLDAKITGWNLRDKKVAGVPMTFLRKSDFPFKGGKENFTPIFQQSSFKYLIYVEGHCAACRYGFMMRLGSVILKVESLCVADQMWYFPMLRPYYDHVPVRPDLSDLFDRIEWCRAHDAECRRIAENAKRLYDQYVSREGILDYMQAILVETARRRVTPPVFARGSTPAQPPPTSAATGSLKLRSECCQVNGRSELCSRCLGLVAARAQQDAAQASQKAESQLTTKEKTQRYLQRMRLQKQKVPGSLGGSTVNDLQPPDSAASQD